MIPIVKAVDYSRMKNGPSTTNITGDFNKHYNFVHVCRIFVQSPCKNICHFNKEFARYRAHCLFSKAPKRAQTDESTSGRA